MSKIQEAIYTIAALDTRLKPIGMFVRLDIFDGAATLWVQDNVDFHIIAYSTWYDFESVDAWAEAQAKLYMQMFNAAESSAQERGAA